MNDKRDNPANEFMIKLYPEIIFKAKARNKPLSAFRVWFLAKHFDRGSGFIPKKDFKIFLKSNSIKQSTAYRWLDQAENLGLLVSSGKYYRVVSWEKAAQKVGVTRVMRFTKVPLERFVRANWEAWVYASYLKHFEGKPISRQTIETQTGIPQRTQYEYEIKANVKKFANYADVCDPVENPELAIDVIGSPGCYAAKGRIRKRLPNSYEASDVQIGNKGRTKQVNEALCSEDSSQQTFYPLYCKDNEQRRRNIRWMQRFGEAQNRPKIIFVRYRKTPNVVLWDATPV
jgi:hypothetical protein